MLLIYKISTFLVLPLVILILFIRVIFKKETFESLSQKILPKKNYKLIYQNCIWFHAASIGEALTIFPIIEEIKRKQNKDPILITTNTISSAKIVKEKIKEYNNLVHRFFPLDNSIIVKKFLNIWKPKLIIFVDSEIWPNSLSIIKDKGIKLILLNARITNKTFTRWKIFRSTARNIFSKFDLCLPCSIESEQNLREIGVEKMKYIGNLKFSQNYFPKVNNRVSESILESSKIWCAASIHEGETEIILKTHLKLKKKLDNIISVIIPRHIINSKKIFKEAEDLGLSAQILNSGQNMLINKEIIIINSFGSLSEFFYYCKNVFIGKSLIKKFKNDGGQNPIEAAKNGCKIFYGPNVSNFTEIYNYLDGLQISKKIKDENELAENLKENFNFPVQKNSKNIEILTQNGKHILDKTLIEIQKFL
ncbi:MAG: hypothetical protein CL687_05075 [Candidatus Pelagibacter sp.]|nr:hypothetical protein [Candidatus Pelagibacter sp.]OUW23318.1 MAG: hypothetical protein CBD34_03470 [Rickettsiales bacterium TMED174]